jgi:hypothetical protein
MKKNLTYLSLLLSLTASSYAQEEGEKVEAIITYDQCVDFRKTPPLRDLLPHLPAVDENAATAPIIRGDRKYKGSVDLTTFNSPEGDGVDGALQTAPAIHTRSAGTKANWQAQNSSSYPPDPSGAAGTDHYIQAINSIYRIYDKDGSTASPQFSLNSLWGTTEGGGDPIVMYDRFADRWFISQFTDPFVTSNDRIFIAVSQTSDALGSYYLYSFAFPNLPDYPKFGVWSNAYFMTANVGTNDCVAYERDKMLLGDPTASKINMSFPNFTQFFNSVAPAYAEGPTLPDADEPCYFFAVQENNWSAAITSDHIKVLKAVIDWDTPTNSSVTSHQTIDTDLFDADFTSGSGWADIVQQGTTQKLDPVAGIFTYKAQYRRFDGYNVVMLCQSVDVGSNRAGIRWYELRDANDGQWFIHQQGTYAPDAQNSRWLGSIAMDQNGNIALAYCFSGPNEYPGIRYTGRFKDDPLGQMTVQEQIAVEGASAQTVTNRYGDYSQMTMDPSDDLTFWFTGEYMGSGGAPRTRVFSFSSWNLLGDEEMEQEMMPFFNAYQPSTDIVRVIWHDLKDQVVTAEVTDMGGKLIMSTEINTADAQADLDVSNVATGIYSVTLTGANTKLYKKLYLAK